MHLRVGLIGCSAPRDDERMDVETWAEAGLYDPGAADAESRLALLEYLTSRGATLAQLVDAHRLGTLPGLAGDLVMPTPPDTRGPPGLATLCCRRPAPQLDRVQ